MRTTPVLGSAVLVVLSGCLMQRMPPDVATSFMKDDMRKLESKRLELYYPSQHKDAALRIAENLDRCLATLSKKATTQADRGKAVVYVTSSNFNNAYVFPQIVGYEQHMVLPTGMSLELFNWMNLGSNEIGDVSCHEAVHYVQMQQTDGFWWLVNAVTGGVLDPNLTQESWFIEGLATYYEGRMGRAVGRPHSPLWRGMFTAGVAANGGRVTASDLSSGHREHVLGGHYLFGSYFIDYLARTYGEDKLWELIDKQGRSVFFPFGVTLRFKSVYGKTIGALLDDWNEELAKTPPPSPVPSRHTVVVDEVGRFARIAASPSDGAIAAFAHPRDDVVRLVVYEPDGAPRFSVALSELLPERRWVLVDPVVVSGMSFTRDGRYLYLLAADLNEVTGFLSRLWKVDARDGAVVKTWELPQALGGAVDPAHERYVYIERRGDTDNLMSFGLADGKSTPLTSFTGRESLSSPSFSPDGRRIAFSRFGAKGFDLALLDGERVTMLTSDGRYNLQPRWADDQRLVFLREHEGRSQAFILDVRDQSLQALSQAPHVALDASVAAGRVLFLNKTGLTWALEAVDLPPAQASTSTDATVPAAAEATAAPGSPSAPTPLSGEADPGANGDEGAPAASVDTPRASTTDPAPASTLPAATPSAPQAGATLEVLADGPASSVEGLFIPRLHAPLVLVLPNAQTQRFTDVFVTGALMGTDRLGFHTWTATGSYRFGSGDNSFGLGYGNAQVAPWFFELGAAREQNQGLTDLQAKASLGRLVYVTPVTFSVEGLDRRRLATDEVPASHVRLWGPRASVSYDADDSTEYVVRRALWASLSGAFYGADRDGAEFVFADVRAEAGVALPLPGLRRQSFFLHGRGRALVGSPVPLLRVGGDLGGALYSAGTATPTPEERGGPLSLNPSVGFSESVRGYEDVASTGTWVGAAGASYRYRFVLDHGWTTGLYLFPSLFLRQVDVEAFAEAGYSDVSRLARRRAAGGRVSLTSQLGGLAGLSLFYQLAYRFDGGLEPLHLFGISAQ